MTRTISPEASDQAVAASASAASAASAGEQLADELGPLLAGERATMAHRCHERQISMAHLFLMTKIEHHGAMPMTKIAELLGSSLPTATGLVTRMEDRGFVRRQHDEHDRRVVNVSLTAAGKRELSGLHAARRRRLAAAVTTFTDAECAQILASIRMLRAALERVDEQGATV